MYNTSGAYLSNQPSFTMPFVYNWLRQPHRTADVLRRAVDEMYDTTRSWLPADFTRTGGKLSFRMSARPGTWGTRAGDVPPSHTDGTDARNSIGRTPDGRGNLGSLDLSDNSLSRERPAEAGAAPGARLELGDIGIEFNWPDTGPGQPDNWIPHGRRIRMDGKPATGISFLGLATNGPSQGTAVVEYTDGSTQSVPVRFTDWTPGTNYQFGNEPLVTTTGRNRTAGGNDTVQTKVFATRPQLLDPAKRVAAATRRRCVTPGCRCSSAATSTWC
ncbi:glycoside hydrolase family 92 protein [Streptomyces sp. DSM 41635]|uniref:Glycoside hydrolase family 92 protein n=1 Tax=Streptomyces edwardsiae TaxID=3075527 RepID=A0ABU2QHY2_9ACTN|nr:glycoside hydrolase domain-containing protein [Streptomyces sp. DSM 41635]MDT0403474.1 glycoside hydrolase family 92 protein [Streptomyces sp. DSM 41635]